MNRGSIALLIFILAGCGGPAERDGGVDAGDAATADSGPSGPDAAVDAGFGPFGVDSWCSLLALAECARDVRCGLLDPAQASDCIARHGPSCDQFAYSEEVDAGRLGFSPDQAAACINAYGSGSCTDTPTACAGVFQGNVTADGGCVLAEECQPGSFCLTYAPTCPFTCYAYVPIGAPCNFYNEACDPAVAVCGQADAGSPYSCLRRGDAGEACAQFGDCLSGLLCLSGSCVTEYAPLGGPCGSNSGYPICGQDAFCRTPGPDGGGICERAVGLGGVCAGGDCLTGLRCSSLYETGTCVPLGSEGDRCTFYGDCKDELYCQASTSTCRPLPLDGGSCDFLHGSGGQCGIGYSCNYTTEQCLPLVPLGGGCQYSSVCQSNDCEYGALADGGFGFRCVLPCSERLDGGF